jgi:hypothetical protein
MDCAVERGLLETHPIRVLKGTAPKVSSQVDRRSIVNPQQAWALLAAVRAQQPAGHDWSPSTRDSADHGLTPHTVAPSRNL